MRQYQETYIKNTKEVIALMQNTGLVGLHPEELRRKLIERDRRVRRIREENTELLRQNLIPLLDNILDVSEEDIGSLVEFTDALMRENLDIGVRYQVCGALVTWARARNKRNLLIKELYMAGMAAHSFQNIAGEEIDRRFLWKVRMFFGEAAGYIRYYDEIDDVETRGYIHRSMGNIALGYLDNAESGEKKLDVLRRSLQVLTDPVYHEKTPELPWDTFIYKTHMERTVLLGYLRKSSVPVRNVREVMESAQYVYDRQMENAKKKGTKPAYRWMYAYYASLYHCGIYSLEKLLQKLEELYASVTPGDYSAQEMYGNIYLPGIYSAYAVKEKGMPERKKPVILMMYRRQAEYLKRAPMKENMDTLFFYMRGCLETYIEYPGENSFREYVEEIIEGREPETSMHSHFAAKIAELLLEDILRESPEALLGVLGIGSVEELLQREEELKSLLYGGAILHDIGKMRMLSLYEVPNRSWIADEEVLDRQHTVYGERILRRCLSTRDFAPMALGHHRWYDGKGGYPEEYRREEVRDAALVDIFSVADYIDKSCDPVGNYQGEIRDPKEVLRELETFSGTRFSPYAVKAAVRQGSALAGLLQEELPGEVVIKTMKKR